MTMVVSPPAPRSRQPERRTTHEISEGSRDRPIMRGVSRGREAEIKQSGGSQRIFDGADPDRALSARDRRLPAGRAALVPATVGAGLHAGSRGHVTAERAGMAPRIAHLAIGMARLPRAAFADVPDPIGGGLD